MSQHHLLSTFRFVLCEFHKELPDLEANDQKKAPISVIDLCWDRWDHLDGSQDLRAFPFTPHTNPPREGEERAKDYMSWRVPLTESFELDPKRKTVMKATEGKSETEATVMSEHVYGAWVCRGHWSTDQLMYEPTGLLHSRWESPLCAKNLRSFKQESIYVTWQRNNTFFYLFSFLPPPSTVPQST